jgi:small subunit ribosomal protein S1
MAQGGFSGSYTGSNGGSAGEGSFAAEFEKLLAERVDSLKPGKVVPGTIVSINKEVATIDIGFKTDGAVRIEEFKTPEGALTAKLGDRLDFFIISLENEEGQVVLSREKAEQKKVWDKVEQLFKDNGTLSGKVIQKVKGGLQVDIGIPAFLPGSQIDIRPHRNLDKFLGESFDFKVLKITRDKGNIVLSRRAVLMSERDQLRSETLKVLNEGVVMEGVVKNITDYGAFIDLGGIDGLLHITDISWGRINHPSERISVGQTIPVVVLKYDPEKERVSLGVKQLKPDPWQNVGQRFPVGSRVKGKVMSVTDYGAFIELEEGVEGLIHVSEMTWSKKVRTPSKIVNSGDLVEAVVIGIDADAQRISLGMKQLLPNPWEVLKERHPVGSRVQGKVRSITDFGVFVGIDDGIDGLVHVSDFSWTKRIKDPKEIQTLYKKGDDVDAIVLDIDAENERLSLGIKQLTNDPWDTLAQRYQTGSRLKGKVMSITDFGVFVEIEEGIEGLIHNSQLALDKEQTVESIFPLESMVECEVVNVDREERRISLSVKALKRRADEREMAGFMNEADAPVTFGDIFREKLGGGSK